MLMKLELLLMIKRVIDISHASYIHLKHQQLLIDQDNKTIGQVSIEDLGVLILQHPAITITQQVVIACQKNNVAIIFCDEKYMPLSLILPISNGNSLHSKVLRTQMSINEPTRKRLWKQIIMQKIKQQAKTLKLLNKDTVQLNRL